MNQNHQIAMDWNKKANEHEDKGNYEEALRCINEALNIEPIYSLFIFNKARYLEKAGRSEEALKIYEEELRKNPENLNAQYYYAQILKKFGRNEEADYYEKEFNIRLNPETSPNTIIIDPKKGALDAYLNKVNTLERLGRIGDAKKICLDYMIRFRENPLIYLKLANLFLSEGSLDSAFDSCNKALNLEPKFFEALTTKGNVLAKKMELKDAIKCYNNALKLKNVPDIGLATTYTSRGGAFIALRDFKNAIKSFDKALKLDSGIGATWFMKGNALLNLGKVEEGMKALKKALELDQGLGPLIDEMLRGMKLR